MQPADRQLADARAALAEAKDDWRLHRKLCNVCTQLRTNRWLWCRDGFDVRRRIQAAERKVTELETPPPDQLTLFRLP